MRIREDPSRCRVQALGHVGRIFCSHTCGALVSNIQVEIINSDGHLSRVETPTLFAVETWWLEKDLFHFIVQQQLARDWTVNSARNMSEIHYCSLQINDGIS